jgi:hypothetical protein
MKTLRKCLECHRTLLKTYPAGYRTALWIRVSYISDLNAASPRVLLGHCGLAELGRKLLRKRTTENSAKVDDSW